MAVGDPYKWHEAPALLRAGKILKHRETHYRIRNGALESKYEAIAGGQWRPATGGLPVSEDDWVEVMPKPVQVGFEEFARWVMKNPKGHCWVRGNEASRYRDAGHHVVDGSYAYGGGSNHFTIDEKEMDGPFFIPESGDGAEIGK